MLYLDVLPISSEGRLSVLRSVVFLSVYLCLRSASAVPTKQDDPPAVRMVVTGAPSLVFDSIRDGCDHYDTPDAPARAFRDLSATTHFFSSSLVNRQSVGSDLQHLKHSCRIAFNGAHNADPSAYNDYGWLASFYPVGNDVYALVHNEYHGHEHSRLCRSGRYEQCWENAITSAVSHDGGIRFQAHTGSSGLVAALPYKYAGDRAGPIGYFSPSNIVRLNNFYYVLFSVIDRVRGGRSGVCVARTQNLDNAQSWQAWDGTSFRRAFSDPYTTDAERLDRQTCVPVGNGSLLFSLGSVLWSNIANTFVLTMRLQNWDHKQVGERTGIYYATSKDLVHWSERMQLLADTPDGTTGEPQLYPSVLDPTSTDPAYSTVGTAALLFTVTRAGAHDNNATRLWTWMISVGARCGTILLQPAKQVGCR